MRPLLNLTKSENEFLDFFIKKTKSLENVPEPHKSKIVFDTDSRKEAMTTLNLTQTNFNFILSSIKKKGYIKDIKGVYKIRPFLMEISSDTNLITIELI